MLKFNPSKEWLAKFDEAEEGVDVSAGVYPTIEAITAGRMKEDSVVPFLLSVPEHPEHAELIEISPYSTWHKPEHLLTDDKAMAAIRAGVEKICVKCLSEKEVQASVENILREHGFRLKPHEG